MNLKHNKDLIQLNYLFMDDKYNSFLPTSPLLYLFEYTLILVNPCNMEITYITNLNK